MHAISQEGDGKPQPHVDEMNFNVLVIDKSIDSKQNEQKKNYGNESEQTEKMRIKNIIYEMFL